MITSVLVLVIPLLSPGSVHAGLTPHARIYINSNSGFTKPDPVNGGGSGTQNNPYIIENWVIDASSAKGISIQNTTSYFIIRKVLIENGGSDDESYAGIYLDNVINGTIENNTCKNNFRGIKLNSSSYCTISGNTCGNCLAYEAMGISLVSSSYDNLIANTCNYNGPMPITYYQEGRGIQLEASSNYNILDGNICSNNNHNGIVLYTSSNNTVSNSTIYNNGYSGIDLYLGSNSNTIFGNNCDNTIRGINFEDTDNYNIVYNNTCTNNHPDGSDDGGHGIGLWNFCSNNTIFNNTCSGNYYGISLTSASSNNTLDNNNCSNNSDIGIYLSSSSNNTITLNYLLNNNHNAHDDGINYWDNGSAGNYWSDYTGVDNYHGENQNIPGPDGIGDTPYNILGGSNQDRYPLMSTWPAGGTTTWNVVNIFHLTLSENFWIYGGSQLLAKFYTYGGSYQDNTVLKNYAPPVHIVDNENISRPGNGAIQRVELVVVDSGGTALGTIATFETSKTIMVARIGQISAKWPFANDATKTLYVTELGTISALWPFAPTI